MQMVRRWFAGGYRACATHDAIPCIACRTADTPEGSPEAHHKFRNAALREADRVRRSRRIALATEIDEIFEQFTSRRKLARNAMWTSLVCLLGATGELYPSHAVY